MLKKIFLNLALTCLVLLGSTVYATSIPNTSSNPKTFLGPTARLSVTKPIGDSSAFSLLGEAGIKNFRINGTLGWQIDSAQRLKASAELLTQKITYSFFDGTENRWVNQGALGADYQYQFQDDLSFNTNFDLAAYISHAPSQGLGSSSGSYINSNGLLTDYDVVKRIAGSNAVGVSPGLSIDTNEGTRFGIALNYDNVRYDTLYRSNTDAKGFGGTAFIKQAITDDVNLGLSGAVRQPFNNYQADLTWGNLHYYGDWTLGLFGAYTIGKHTLPTTYNIGLAANYILDGSDNPPVFTEEVVTGHYKDQVVFKDQPKFIPPQEWEPANMVDRDFLSWVSEPAVYMPQVLAIADERVTETICTPPSFSGTINNQEGEGATVVVSNFFVGSNLNYTINTTPANSNGYTFNGTTLAFNNTINYTVVTITATNSCGSATSNEFTFNID